MNGIIIFKAPETPVKLFKKILFSKSGKRFKIICTHVYLIYLVNRREHHVPHRVQKRRRQCSRLSLLMFILFDTIAADYAGILVIEVHLLMFIAGARSARSKIRRKSQHRGDMQLEYGFNEFKRAPLLVQLIQCNCHKPQETFVFLFGRRGILDHIRKINCK